MDELTISLQTGVREPMYEQIYRHIRKEIELGKIRAGEKLPSSRKLAQYLQISRTTVEQAYDQLVAEGYLKTEACKGYYACEMDTLLQRPDAVRQVEKKQTEKKQCKVPSAAMILR